jgi:serine/threonine-protein kinase ATR
MFGSLQLLETVGRGVCSQPGLLPELAALAKLPEQRLVAALVPHVLGSLCCSQQLPELQARCGDFCALLVPAVLLHHAEDVGLHQGLGLKRCTHRS